MTASKLEAQGIDSVQKLIGTPADTIAEITGFYVERVESIVAANETGSELVAWLEAATGTDGTERVSHAELKHRAARSRGAVRTGETTPYANVILVAGVAFS